RGALELLQLAAVEVEKAQHQAVGVHHQLAARAEGDLGALDSRLNQDRLARRRLLRRGEGGLVLVAQRQVQDEIEPGAQAEFLESCRLHPLCRIASISTTAPRGSPETPTAARAG